MAVFAASELSGCNRDHMPANPKYLLSGTLPKKFGDSGLEWPLVFKFGYTLGSSGVLKAADSTPRDFNVTGMGFSLGMQIFLNLPNGSTGHLRIAGLLDILPAPAAAPDLPSSTPFTLAGLCFQASGLSAALVKQDSPGGPEPCPSPGEHSGGVSTHLDM